MYIYIFIHFINLLYLLDTTNCLDKNYKIIFFLKCFKKFLLLIMWFLCQLQKSYLVCDTATIGYDLTESETRRTVLQNYKSGFLIYPFPQL